jgi:two-component system, NarL family, invasion response regulator UvrY
MKAARHTVALIDDHILLRNGLATLIREFGDYQVLFEANNGKHFQDCLARSIPPDVVLLDINMPEMDGYETAAWIREFYPDIKVIALSMDDKDKAIIRMLRNGARGYILKDVEPGELRRALNDVLTNGYFYSEMVTSKLIHNINKTEENELEDQLNVALSEREHQFLKLACTEMTYKEIADAMFLSPRTIDGYRDTLFLKLQVKTRVGLVIYSLRNEIVKL